MQIFNFTILLEFLALISISSTSISEVRSAFRSLFIWKESQPYPEGGKSLAAFADLLQEWEQTLPKSGFYFGMHPANMHIVSTMKNLILAQPTAIDAIALAAQLRDLPEVNPIAWLNAVTAASISRPDWMGLSVPSIVEVLPGNFIPGEIIAQMKADVEAGRNNYEDPDTCHATVDGTIGEDNGDENILWYFREDVMVNAHHWFWHIVNPIDAPKGTIDRKGELFYYFHHSVLARFHTERIANEMDPVELWDGAPGSTIWLGYNSHLTEANSAINWTPRGPDLPSSDISNGKLVGTPMVIKLEDRWAQIQNVIGAIEKGEAVPIDTPDMPVNLRDSKGIDILGSMIEATVDSINPDLYYGYGIHNSGHNIQCFAEDPDESKDLPPGVMGEASTAMRDTMFYRHHAYVDYLFTTHQALLEPYNLSDGEWPLVLNGITVDSIKVQMLQEDWPENSLVTVFETRRYDLSKGLDFNRTDIPGPLYVCQDHVNHMEFEYHLEITRGEDAEGFSGKANVRIFLGVKVDKDGNPHTYEQLRNLMFVLDTFSVDLEPGLNTITRNSKETPLTIDFPQGLSEVETPQISPYCGCGWPHHMLLPAGKNGGLPFDLFAIVTNAADDFVEELPEPRPECKEAYIYCGLLGAKYPDARPMGWPFDRRINLGEGVEPTIENFAATVSNAAHAEITIIQNGSKS